MLVCTCEIFRKRKKQRKQENKKTRKQENKTKLNYYLSLFFFLNHEE